MLSFFALVAGLPVRQAGLLLAPPSLLAAKVDYRPSQQLPGLNLEQSAGQASSLFPQFIRWVLPFVLSLAAVLAVIMIVVAGVELVIKGDRPAARENAKAQIWAAIGGLVLAFAAFLILRTINPDLVGLKFDLGAPPSFTPAGTAGGTGYGERVQRVPLGESCSDTADCQVGLECRDTPTNTGMQSLCSYPLGTTVASGPDQACGRVPGSNNLRCQPGLICVFEGGAANEFRSRYPRGVDTSNLGVCLPVNTPPQPAPTQRSGETIRVNIPSSASDIDLSRAGGTTQTSPPAAPPTPAAPQPPAGASQ
ncbi:MAG: hypothetical protein HYU35_00355 [Parcubacteria group bacterium]|nr:hypothetical protein [Parcubacteria group bacterium]